MTTACNPAYKDQSITYLCYLRKLKSAITHNHRCGLMNLPSVLMRTALFSFLFAILRCASALPRHSKVLYAKHLLISSICSCGRLTRLLRRHSGLPKRLTSLQTLLIGVIASLSKSAVFSPLYLLSSLRRMVSLQKT